MELEIFDERICALGEGPSAVGVDNCQVSWVDITGSRVLSRNLLTGDTDEFPTGEPVGFAIPRTVGGFVLGTDNGPVLRDSDGGIHSFLKLSEIEPLASQMEIRWNDAKVSPRGNLWLGTMGVEMLKGTSALFKYDVKNSSVSRVIPNLTISNGMDWSDDGSTFYFIDSDWQEVRAFSVIDDEISDERSVIRIAESEGAPDGMCMDASGGVWVALWGGSQVRRYDSTNNFKLDQVINLPAPFVTSCAFAGENLDTLIITSATDDKVGGPAEAGMTFCIKQAVSGRPSRKIDL